MLHFFFGLFFLLLTLLLTGLYLCTGVLVVLLVKGVYHVYRQWREVPLYGAWRDAAGESLARAVAFFRSRRFAYLVLLLVSFQGSLYVQQRAKWMGKENGNYTAKEYWVAGQGVYVWRALWAQVGGHPEALVMRPLTALQQWAYRRGHRYLPEGDGERGVWTDLWFVYPYSRNMLLPKDNSDMRTSAATKALLERSWRAMEEQASGSYADRRMEEEYYRNLPGEAFFYDLYKESLTGHLQNGRKTYSVNKEFIDRDKKIRQWLQALPEKWATSKEVSRFVESHPKVEAMRQLVILMMSASILHSYIYTNNFSCTDPDVQEYMDARIAFVGDGMQKASWQRMGQSEQGKRLYSIGVNTMISRFSRYVLKRFCGKEVPGQEETLLSAGKTWSEQDYLEDFLYSVFGDELVILDTMYPDIPYGVGGEFTYKNLTKEYREKYQEIRRQTEAIMQSRLSDTVNEQKGAENGTR